LGGFIAEADIAGIYLTPAPGAKFAFEIPCTRLICPNNDLAVYGYLKNRPDK
jgi:hypothetical protein